MKILENLKLEKWWACVLYLGVAAMVAALMFPVDFIEERHLFGLGIGLTTIGFSFFIAEKEFSAIKPSNAYTGDAAMIGWTEIKHNWLTVILLTAGVVITVLFGFLITKGLI